MKHKKTFSTFVAFLTIVGLTYCFAQEKRPMTFVDLLKVQSLQDPQLSPTGEQLLYVLGETDWKENKQINHIWRINVDGTGSLQMTNGSNGETSPRWSPDGKQIAFLAKRDDAKETKIYLLNNSGGEASQLSDHATTVSNIQWSPDGASIYFLAPDPKTKEEKVRDKAKDDVYAFDENYKQKHLWKISISDTSEYRITEGDFSIRGYRLSDDGNKVVFHRTPTPLYDDSNEGEVWIMDADCKDLLQLTNNSVGEGGAALSPDNSKVLFLSGSNELFETYYNRNIFVVSSHGGNPRMLLPDMPFEIQAARWSFDGKKIYFLANTGIRVELFEMNLSNEKLKQLTKGDHFLRSWSYYPELNRHIYCMNNATNAGDVWMLSNKKSKNPKRITQVYEYLLQEFHLPRQEAVQWKGEDGVTVEGIIVYPLNYQKGQSYPLVVKTHGGPASSDKFRFGGWLNYEQVLAAKGYAVFKPNYRGSTGYGDDFLRDMVGHYYRQSHLDVMAGVDHLIALGIADGEKMVKVGWSAGGHMTNKIITHTNRFKAASSGAGAVNWISMYGQSDVRIYRTPWFGGSPWPCSNAAVCRTISSPQKQQCADTSLCRSQSATRMA